MSDGRNDTNTRRPQTMRNRDIPLLRDVAATMELVTDTEKTLDFTHDRMMNISSHLSGMPGGGALPKGLETAFALLEEAGEAHGAQVRQYVKELRQAERVINAIESRNMRAFVIMKYMLNMPDRAIRRALNMTEYGFNRARRSVEEAENMESVRWNETYILSHPEG